MQLMINSFFNKMDTPYVSIRTQQKRDRLLSLLMVSQEHERIAQTKYHLYQDLYKNKKESYLQWCKDNNVESFIPDVPPQS